MICYFEMVMCEHVSASKINTNLLPYSMLLKHLSANKDLATNLLEILFVHRKVLFLQIISFR